NRLVEKNIEKRKVLFVMQHSTETEMLEIARAFEKIDTSEYELMVKPHPHQEPGVLNKVKVILGSKPTVNFFGAESDTYELIEQSEVIVGLFSSVLYESILVGKKVIVADFFQLNDSVNFANLGLALKAENQQQLASMIEQCINDEEFYSRVAENVIKYLKKNPHLNVKSMKNVFNQFVKNYLI
ncbi:MAG: beta-3-deoxy-D-manno-oct-2-ulosonic acid transferase, partial [Pseudomonadota bacterium]|nr:beta-3-deoxy-D-manno-oct-2-ulosonic acid transferase [Pseudomonadota bacterium]